MMLPRRWSSALLAGAIAAVSACGAASPVGVEFPASPVDAHVVAPPAPVFQFGRPQLIDAPDAVTLGPAPGSLGEGGPGPAVEGSASQTGLGASISAAAAAGTLFRARSNYRSYRSNYAVAW